MRVALLPWNGCLGSPTVGNTFIFLNFGHLMPLFAKNATLSMATEMIQLYYTMLRSPSFNSTCLIQCISYTVVNCIYKYYTMLLSPSFNSTYKIIQCCKKVPTLHQYSTRLIWRISACVLRHDIIGVTTLLSIWLPPVSLLPLYWLPPYLSTAPLLTACPVSLLSLYWLPPVSQLPLYWLPPVIVLPIYRLPPPFTLLPLY